MKSSNYNKCNYRCNRETTEITMCSNSCNEMEDFTINQTCQHLLKNKVQNQKEDRERSEQKSYLLDIRMSKYKGESINTMAEFKKLIFS